VAPPPQGSELELEGVILNGVFTITEMESEEDGDGEVEIKGVLAQVNPGEKTIVINIAGAQVTVNIGEAIIKGKDGQLLTLSDLESLVGTHIRVEGLYQGNGLLFTKEVSVDVEEEQDELEDALEEMTKVGEELEELLAEAEEAGVTPPEAMVAQINDLLDQAQAASDAENFEEAEGLAEQADDLLDDLEDQVEDLINEEEG
jgi:ElaB/YqjD/DUF883 family membrane-anchored ribosome-binding protein